VSEKRRQERDAEREPERERQAPPEIRRRHPNDRSYERDDRRRES
jgi:hypothetical protein